MAQTRPEGELRQRREARHASRAGSTYKSFVRDVAERGGFTLSEAEDYAIAVVATLEERLTLPEVLDLEAQLPSIMKDLLDDEPIMDIPRMQREQFCERVATRLDMVVEDASPIVRDVFAVLRSHISAGEARHVEAQLPDDLKEMWRSP